MFTVEDAQPDSKLTLSTLCWWWWWVSWLLLEVALLKKKTPKSCLDLEVELQFWWVAKLYTTFSWFLKQIGTCSQDVIACIAATGQCSNHSNYWNSPHAAHIWAVYFQHGPPYVSQVRLCWIRVQNILIVDQHNFWGPRKLKSPG